MNSVFINISVNEWYLFFIFLTGIIAIILIAEMLRSKNLLSNNVIRQIIHINVGIGIAVTPHIFDANILPILLATIFTTINIISIYQNKLKSFHKIKRISYGTIYFPLSYIIICALFWEYKYHLTICFLILAISDPIASIIPAKLKILHLIHIKSISYQMLIWAISSK